MENMATIWNQADIIQRNRMLSSMMEAVLLYPASRTVVGLLPKPAFRDIILDVEPSAGVVIYDPLRQEKQGAEVPQRLKRYLDHRW